MAASFNSITLVGFLGRDPETRMASSDTLVSSFSMATSERRRGPDGQQQEQTTWWRVSAFGRLAEIASEYLHRGGYVCVVGSVSSREYTTRDGKTGVSLDVRAKELHLLDKRSGATDAASEPAMVAMGAASTDADLGDLPF